MYFCVYHIMKVHCVLQLFLLSNYWLVVFDCDVSDDILSLITVPGPMFEITRSQYISQTPTGLQLLNITVMEPLPRIISREYYSDRKWVCRNIKTSPCSKQIHQKMKKEKGVDDPGAATFVNFVDHVKVNAWSLWTDIHLEF